MAKTKNGIYYPDDYSLVADVPGDMKETAESVDKVIDDYKKENTTNKEDISNIKKEQTAQDQKIDTLEKENTSLKQEIKQQYYTKEEIEKVIDKKEVEGNEIHIEDAKEFNMIELEIEGKSEQKSRSGKNKLNLKDIKQQSNCTVFVDDEKLTVTATGTGNPAVVINCSLEAGEYYLHLDNPISGINVSFYNNSETKIGSNINTSNSFTLPEKAATMRINSSISAGNYNLPFESLYINIGNTDLGYEEYGASPSPEFPSQIENVEGWNKFDKNSVTNGYYLNESGNLVASANYCVSDFIEVEEGEKYFIPKRNTSRTKYYLSDKTAYSNTWDVSDYAQVITIPVGVKYIRFSILISGNDAVDLNTFQFIKGSEEKPYAPYNSLILNDVGKNIIPFPYYDKRTAINGVEVEVKNDGSIILNGTATATGYFHLIYNDNIELQAGDYYLSGLTSGSISTYYLQSFINGKSGLAQTTTPQKYIILEGDILDRISLFFLKNTVFNNLVIKPQFEYGQSTDYEPYKYQVAYFPLAEGQKLMQGSYISDTGIHHKRKQIELEGTENWIALNKTYYMPVSDKRSNKELGKNSLLSNQFKQTEYMVDTIVISKGFITETYYITGNKNVFFNYDDGVGGVDNWKAYLAEQYANGTPVILEYELAEPFTAEQQTAWNNVKAMKLFEGVNNITVNATIKPNIRFKYAQDLKKRIERIEQLLASETVSEEVQNG